MSLLIGNIYTTLISSRSNRRVTKLTPYQGVFAGVLVSPDFLRVFPTTKDANVNGLTSSCFFLGAGVGAIAAFVLGDKLGRRKTIALGLFCNAVGAILQTLSWQLAQMITGRLVNGFGIGLVSTMSPVYLSECVKSHVRGMLMGIGTCCNVLCFCIANCKSTPRHAA